MPEYTLAVPQFFIRAETDKNVMLPQASVYGFARSTIGDTRSPTCNYDPDRKPLVAYMRGLKVCDNGCLDRASALIQRLVTYARCGVRFTRSATRVIHPSVNRSRLA